MEDDMPEEVALLLLSLPADVQLAITSLLLPANLFADPSGLWVSAVQWSTCCRACAELLGEAMREAAPGLSSLAAAQPAQPAAWSRLAGKIYSGGSGRWLQCSPLRAVRPIKPSLQPLQNPPRLSGATLCTLVSPGTLCCFGGRASASADTSDATRLCTVSWPSPTRSVAIWDLLLTDARPPARCYHTATMCNDSSMIVFGGAGEGEALRNDAWSLSRGSSSASAVWQWQPLAPRNQPPAPRSSHVCAYWEERAALVVHGGLGSDGVTGDTWLLTHSEGGTGGGGQGGSRGGGGGKGGGAFSGPCEWVELSTAGPSVKRAHACGGLVRSSASAATLVLYSGQDERLLTVHDIATLCLATATWSIARLPSEAPSRGLAPAAAAPVARIDAAASAVRGVGLLVFGGVGDSFEFVPRENAWLLRSGADTMPVQPAVPVVAATTSTAAAAATNSTAATSTAATASATVANNRTFAASSTTTATTATIASTTTTATTATIASKRAPRARACLGMCTDGLRAYTFGGFDGEHDLDDLWCLSLLPDGMAEAAAAGGAAAASQRPQANGSGGGGEAAAATAPVWAGRTQEEMERALEAADEIKRRRSHQAQVLHGTPGANGHNFVPIHVLVGQAAHAYEAYKEAQIS